MRCQICDYNDEGISQSFYHTSLVEKKGSRKRFILLNKETGETICSVCSQKEDFK